MSQRGWEHVCLLFHPTASTNSLWSTMHPRDALREQFGQKSKLECHIHHRFGGWAPYTHTHTPGVPCIPSFPQTPCESSSESPLFQELSPTPLTPSCQRFRSPHLPHWQGLGSSSPIPTTCQSPSIFPLLGVLSAPIPSSSHPRVPHYHHIRGCIHVPIPMFPNILFLPSMPIIILLPSIGEMCQPGCQHVKLYWEEGQR